MVGNEVMVVVGSENCVKSIVNGKDCIPIACTHDCVRKFGSSAEGQCISFLECQCTYPC